MIDLSSDTATRPSEGMRRAMVAARENELALHPDGARVMNAAAPTFGYNGA